MPRILKQSKRNGVGSPGDDLCIVLRDGEEVREFFEEKGGERERGNFSSSQGGQYNGKLGLKINLWAVLVTLVQGSKFTIEKLH